MTLLVVGVKCDRIKVELVMKVRGAWCQRLVLLVVVVVCIMVVLM